MIRVEEYITAEGYNPFAAWFDRLDACTASKINTYLTRIAGGNTSSLKPIKGTLQEVRIDWGPGYRVYVGRDGAVVVILLGGGSKQRQHRDIERAAVFWEEYKRRKKGEKHGNYAAF